MPQTVTCRVHWHGWHFKMLRFLCCLVFVLLLFPCLFLLFLLMHVSPSLLYCVCLLLKIKNKKFEFKHMLCLYFAPKHRLNIHLLNIFLFIFSIRKTHNVHTHIILFTTLQLHNNSEKIHMIM